MIEHLGGGETLGCLRLLRLKELGGSVEHAADMFSAALRTVYDGSGVKEQRGGRGLRSPVQFCWAPVQSGRCQARSSATSIMENKRIGACCRCLYVARMIRAMLVVDCRTQIVAV